VQDRHLKYAITLFGLGVSMLHSEYPQAISRVNVSFDSLRERWQEDNRQYPALTRIPRRERITPDAVGHRDRSETSRSVAAGLSN
jgi:hypothetical protein